MIDLYNEKVIHESYGLGTIISCTLEQDVFNAKFDEKTIEFEYPMAFNNGLLLLDDAIAEKVENDILALKTKASLNTIEEDKKIEEIKTLIKSETIKELLKEYLVDKYEVEIIKRALQAIEFDIKYSTDFIVNDNLNNEDYYVEPDDFNYIIIKTTPERVDFCKGSLYEATRFAWVLSLNRASQYEYVFSVIRGIVQCVYKVFYWRKVMEGESAGRCEFFGEKAEDSIQKRFVGKRIPPYYSKKGQASPILYKK